MQKHSPKISVIVPIYNVSEFLDECIISIIEQTYTNLEIILVDDGSTDDCGIKCDQFACSDKRIIVIHKKNGGLSDARNSALDICTGEYLTFIDSDDAVSNDYISTLYSTIKATNTEISVCAYNESIKKVFEQPTSTFIKRFTQQYTIKSILQESIISTSAWGKLYKSHLFNDVRFPYGQIFEDLSTIWKVFDKVEAISYNSHIGYFYRINPNSITNKSFSKRVFEFK